MQPETSHPTQPEPGEFSECASCPERDAGCTGNSEVRCSVPDEAARIIRTAIEGSLSNVEAEQYAELDGQPPKLEDSGYADDWRSRQLPVHAHDEHGNLVPKPYRSFAKGVRLQRVDEDSPFATITHGTFKRGRRWNVTLLYKTFGSRREETVVTNATVIKCWVDDKSVVLLPPLPTPEERIARGRAEKAEHEAACRDAACWRSGGDPVNMSAEAQGARLQYVGLTRSNGKASATAKQPLADESWQERHFEVDQTGTEPPLAIAQRQLNEALAQAHDLAGQVNDLTAKLNVERSKADERIAGLKAEAQVMQDNFDNALKREARAKQERADLYAEKRAMPEVDHKYDGYPDSVVALVEALHEWFTEGHAPLTDGALLFDDDHSLAEHVASCHEQLTQNGSSPLAQLQRDLDKLDWELVAAYREHEHANGYRLTYITLCKRLRPVFPEAPYVVSHWSGGDTLPSGFGGTHYDLTLDRAKQVFVELFSENVC